MIVQQFERVKNKRNWGVGFLLILLTWISVRAITPDFHTWSTTASDAGIYLAFIPNFWVAHPGGATVYTFIGWIWSNVFLGFGINPNISLLLLNSFIAIITAGVAYWWGIKKGLRDVYAALAAFSVIISAIAFSQFGVIESYPMHGLLILLFLISFDSGWSKRQILFGGLALGSHHTLLLIVALTYLLGLFFGKKTFKVWRGIPVEAVFAGLVGLGLYATIIVRALMGWTFDAQIDNTFSSIQHYFRALTPILQLHIFDIPHRIVAVFPVLIMSFLVSLLIIFFAFSSGARFEGSRLYIILSGVYILYVVFYISMQGYRYYTLVPILMLPIVFEGLRHLQKDNRTGILSLIGLWGASLVLVPMQTENLYPNDDMELMRDKLYEIREEAFRTGEQQIIFTQYYNEVIGTYWNEVFNYEFLDESLYGEYSKENVNEWGGMNLGWRDDARVAAMYSPNSPVIVIPSIYTIQKNRISERYQELIRANATGTFDIGHCFPEDRKFIPFESYACVGEQGLIALQGNENIWYMSVNPHDILGEQYGFKTYLSKQDPTSFIQNPNANYFSRWTDVLWPATVSGRPYWAAFIRGDFEHPYWDSDNFNSYFTVMFIGGWGFIIGFILLWGWKAIRTRKSVGIEEAFK